MIRAELAEIIVVGRVNGMGEPDPQGSYLCVGVSDEADFRRRFKISLGAAQVLASELQGASA